jgi:hypothetical protein
MVFLGLLILVLFLEKSKGNNATFLDIQSNFQFAFLPQENQTVNLAITGYNLYNVTHITVYPQNQPSYECTSAGNSYGYYVDACLKGISRNASCALTKVQYPNWVGIACDTSYSPCTNITTGSSCVALTNINDYCYNSLCLNPYVPVCLAMLYTQLNLYSSHGLAGVNCDEYTVCNDKFKCVPNNPPDQCLNHIQCQVDRIYAGVADVIISFMDGTNVSSTLVQNTLVGFQQPAVTFAQNMYISPTSPFVVAFAPTLASLNASVAKYACIDETGQNTSFNISSDNVFPLIDFVSSSTVALGTSIVYPLVTCTAVLDYLDYGFTTPLANPESNLTFRFLPLPQVYSVCPNQILSDIPSTVTIQGDDIVNTPNLKCVFDNNIYVDPIFISVKSVVCTLVYANRTSPAVVNLTLTNDGISVSRVPLIINVIGACSKIKPNSVPSGSSCICPAGYQDVSNAYCQLCADGFYQPNPNQQACIPCDATETTNGILGSKTPSACVCKSGLYRPAAGNTTQQQACTACPFGLSCAFAANGTYTVLPGFWRAKAGSTVIVKCAGGASQCPAGNSGSGNQLCAEGYKGPACSVCKRGYGNLGGSCLKCPDKGLNVFLLMVLILVTGGLIYVLVQSTTRREEKGDTVGITVKVLVAYMQVLYYVGKTSAHWSDQSTRFFQALIPVTLSPSFLSIQCSTDFGFYSNIALMMALPLIIVGGIASLHLFLYVFKNNQRSGSYEFMDLLDDNSKTTLVLLSLVHPTISQDVIRSFKCTSVDGTGTSFMSDDMRVDCSSESYRKYVVVAALYTVFYIAGFLALVMWRIIVNKDFVDMANSGMYILNAKIYVFFIRGYKRDYYLWEFMIIFRKIAIVIINSLFPEPIQLVWASLVIGVSLAYTVSALPYRSVLVNRLDILALATLMFTIVLGFHSRLLNNPNAKAVFVLLVLTNTFTTGIIMLAAFNKLKPKVAEIFQKLAYLIDFTKYTRKEFTNSGVVPEIKMYSREELRKQKQQSQRQIVEPVDKSWGEDEIEL